jgi:hypothetical protein
MKHKKSLNLFSSVDVNLICFIFKLDFKPITFLFTLPCMDPFHIDTKFLTRLGTCVKYHVHL